MGRTFDGANPDYLNIDSAVYGNNWPWSISAHARCENVADLQPLYAEGRSTDDIQWNFISAAGNIGGDPARQTSRAGGTNAINHTGNGYSLGVWFHIAAVWAAADSRTNMLDGDVANKGISTASRTPVGVNRSRVGSGPTLTGAGPGEGITGTIGALSGFDIDLEPHMPELAAGRDPLTLPSLPTMHLPMTGGIQQIISAGPVFTNVGSTEGSHKPIGW